MKQYCFLLMLIVALSSCEGKDARCRLPIDSGICYGNNPRYAFDVTTNKCKQFVYGGCMGNDNRFNNLEECEAVCYTHRHKRGHSQTKTMTHTHTHTHTHTSTHNYPPSSTPCPTPSSTPRSTPSSTPSSKPSSLRGRQ